MRGPRGYQAVHYVSTPVHTRTVAAAELAVYTSGNLFS